MPRRDEFGGIIEEGQERDEFGGIIEWKPEREKPAAVAEPPAPPPDEPVVPVVSERFPPLTPGTELSPQLRKIAAPPGYVEPQPEKSFLSTITEPPQAPRMETIKGGPPVIPDDAKVTFADIGEEFSKGIVGGGQIANVKEYPPTAIEKIFANTINAPIAAAFGEDVAAQIPRSLINQGIGLTDFATSPLGIVTAAGGSVSKAAKIAAGIYFAKDLSKSIAEQAEQAGMNWNAMSPAEKADAIVTILATGVMTGAIVGHTGAEIGKSAAAPIIERQAMLGPSKYDLPAAAEASALQRNTPGAAQRYAPGGIETAAPKMAELKPDQFPKRRKVAGTVEVKEPVQPTGELLSEKPADFEKAPPPVEKKGPVEVFDEEASADTGSLSNKITEKAGMAIRDVSDFDKLVELKDRYQQEYLDAKKRYDSLPEDQKTIKEMENLMRLTSRIQYAREVIETATNTGSWVEGGLTKLGERPLDWRKSPEAADWLVKNGEKVGISIPEELKAKAAATPPPIPEPAQPPPIPKVEQIYKDVADNLKNLPEWEKTSQELNRIIAKFERGETLTEREQKDLDKLKQVTDEAFPEGKVPPPPERTPPPIPTEAKPPVAPEAEMEGKPVTEEDFQRDFGLTPEEARANMAILDAAGIDVRRLRVTKGGIPAKDALNQLKPKYRKVLKKAIDEGHPDAKLFQEALDVQNQLDANKLFWELNPKKSWLETNKDYWKSVDPDLLCQRSEGTDAAVNYLKQVLGDKYESSMAWEVVARANAKGLQTPCPQCYVFSARAKSGGAMQKKYIIGVGGYNGEILRTKEGGLQTIIDRALRHYSSTDFKAEHIPGLIAETIDLANRGLPGAGYSKQGDFAIIFGPAGMHVNLSVGRNSLVGMPMEEALALRAKYKNVATIYVSFTDAETIAAIKNPQIDHVIPWHGSSQKRKLLAKRMGIGENEIVDYQMYDYKGVRGNYQNETKNGKKARRQIKEKEHGGDLNKYLALVEKYKLTKKFPQIYDALKAEGNEALYMKLIGPEYGKHGGAYPYEPMTKNINFAGISDALKNRLKTRLASNKEFIDIAREIASEVRDGTFEPGDVKPEIANGPFVEKTAKQTEQQISSKKTSRKQIPALFKSKVFEPAGDNLDIGAGAYDLGTNHLKEKRGVDSVPFDPFNRTPEANRAVIDQIVGGRKFGSVTVPNVLNVIDSPTEILNVITQAARALKPGGKAYFQIHEGSGPQKGNGIGRETRDGWQNYRKTETYIPAISERFNKVEQKGNIIIASDPKPNIPTARWRATPGAIYEMYQGKKASVEFKPDGTALIRALENPDVSSGVHEIAHVIRRFLLDRNVLPENRTGITDQHIEIAEKWAGVKDGKWSIRAEEKFARGFEKYLRDGKAPTPKLAEVFSMFKNWLTKIYRQLKGSPINVVISPEMRGVYDAIMGRGEARRIAAEATPPPVPGGLVRPSPLGETGLKHAIDELERVSYGFKERPIQDRQDMAEAWDRSGNVMSANPMAGRELAQALIDNPTRGLTGDESALLLRHKVALENAINRAAEKLLSAEGEAKVEAQASFDRNKGELNALLDAVATRGSEWGREGRWRQALAYEDYSFATQERLLAAAKGRPLTPAETTELRSNLLDYQTKLDAFERWKNERTQKEIDDAVSAAIDQLSRGGLVKEAELPYSRKALEVVDRMVKYWDEKADAARQNILKRTSRFSAGLDPMVLKDVVVIGISKLMHGVSEIARWKAEMVKDVGDPVKDYLDAAWKQANAELNKEITKIEKSAGTKIAKKVKEKVEDPTPQSIAIKVAERIDSGEPISVSPMVRKMARMLLEEGVTGRENLIDAVHEILKVELPEVTRSEVMQMISGYGEYRMLPKDEISVKLRGYKGEMQQILKLEDMARGEAPKKTGGERRTPTDEERRILKEVEDAKKKGGFTVTDPESQLRSALQTAKTVVMNQIKDLEFEISKKEKILKKKNVLTPDEELLSLRAKRDELRKVHQSLFGKTKLTEEQKIRMVEASLDKQIADIEAQLATGEIFPSKTPPAPKPSTPGIEAKRLRLAELKLERYYQREQIQPSVVPEVQESNRLTAAMNGVRTRLANQIDKLEAAIAKREKILKQPSKIKYDDEMNRLKAERDEKRKEYDEIFPREPISEARRLELWKERTQKKIDEMNDRMARGDFSERPKRPEIELDKQGNKLQALLDETKDKFRAAREKAEFEAMDPFQKAKRRSFDAYDAARMLMTTGEFSFVLRQGKWSFLAHPLMSVQAIPKAFQAMKSWRAAHEVDLDIFNHPDFAAAKRAKLHLVDEGASLTRMEELYAARLGKSIPGIAAFNRAARVFLNKIRFDTWQSMRKTLSRSGTPTPLEDAAIATFVNESTGRGGLGPAEPAALVLGRTFFAPRYMISRFQLLAGHSMWQGNARSRMVIAREYARALVGLGIYYTMLNAAFSLDKDKKPMSFDPRSTDFGKIRIGNTRIDVLAGLAQVATFLGRTVTGETKMQSGKVVDIRKPKGKKQKLGEPTWFDVAARYGRSKLHPIPGTIVNLFNGTAMDGSETDLVKETGNLVGPITYYDIYKAFKQFNLPEASALALLAFFGEGLQTYEKKKQ